MKLSIVITCLADPDLINTIKSIRDTAGSRPEIIVVHDGRPTPLDVDHNLIVVQNFYRCGVGPSRHIGVLHAHGEYVVFCDSHMRFLPGWYEQAMTRIEGRPKTIHCATCLGLDSSHLDPNAPKSRYYGAKLQLFGEDTNAPGKFRVLEGVWTKEPPVDDAQIGCLMGACYFMRRDWFLHLDALRWLRSWGGDEVSLSLKCLMFGGDIRLMRNVEVGHVFLKPGEQQPFKVPVGHVAHNKLFLIHTLANSGWFDYLMEKMMVVYGGGELSTGQKILGENWHLVEAERARVKTLAVHDFDWCRAHLELLCK